MIYFYIFLFALAGGLAYRIRGGLIPAIPIAVCRFVFSLPFAIPATIEALHAQTTVGMIAWIFAGGIILALTDLAVTTGHGEWQGYKEPMTGTAEKEDVLIGWLAPTRFDLPPLPADQVYWYKFLGMMMNGSIIAFPAAILGASPVIWLGGALKSVAYAIGWKIYPTGSGKGISGFNQATQVGEFLFGCFAWLGIALNIAFHL